MKLIKSNIEFIQNYQQFKSYWQSLNIDKRLISPEPGELHNMMDIFMEIQDLGIVITEEQKKLRISDIINNRFGSDKTSVNDLREYLIEQLSSDELVISMTKDYLNEMTAKGWTKEMQHPLGMMRDGLFYELGLRYPEFTIVFSDELEQNEFRIRINDSLTFQFTGLGPEDLLTNDTKDRLTLLNIIGETAINPANGNECSIISRNHKETAELAGLTTWDSLGYFILCLSSILRDYGKCFITSRIINSELDKLETAWPKLVELAKNQYSVGLITKVIRLLIEEQISLRNLRMILIAMLEADYIATDPGSYIVFDERLPVINSASAEESEKPKFISEYVRSKLKEYITYKYTRGGNTLVAYLLDPEIEDILKVSARDKIPVSLTDHNRIMDAISNEIDNLPPTSQIPVILTYNTIRSSFKELIKDRYPRLAVLAYNELSPTTNIQPIARITFY